MIMLNHKAQRVLVASSLLFVAGCGFLAPVFGPVHETSTSNVDQSKDEGYLRFTNTTSDHMIFIDGKPVGAGDDYSSSRVLAVPPGPHLVEITQGSTTILSQKVFIGSGSTRNIAIQ
jgi:hypothetical protein